MWRSHFVVLGEKPDEARLLRVTDGYQLWRESRTGLFYLTTYSAPLGRRPDFGQFLDRSMDQLIDLSVLDHVLSEARQSVAIQKDEISFDLVRQTATLSKQLAMPVLAAEDTDDEYGMAVGVDQDVITYLRFKSMLKDAPEDDRAVEVVYTPETGIKLDHDFSQHVYGVAQKAIEEVYGIAGLDLVNYAHPKPSRDEAKKYAAKSKLSVQAYLDSYGVFKRVHHAPPRLTLRDRVLIPFRFAASALMIPPIVVGMFVYSVIFTSATKTADPALWKVALVGVATLALIAMAIIWLGRVMLGY